eukprot:g16520.t1
MAFPVHEMGSRGRPKECEECEQLKFIDVFCPECDQWMCSECDALIHKKGKRARHVRQYLERQDSSSKVDIASSEPVPPPRPPSRAPPKPSPESSKRAIPARSHSSSFGPSSRPPAPPSFRALPTLPQIPDNAPPPPPPPSSGPPSSAPPVPVRTPPPVPPMVDGGAGGGGAPPLTPERQSYSSSTSSNGSDSPSHSMSLASPNVSPSLLNGSPGGAKTKPTQPKLLKTGMLKKKKKKGFRVYQDRYFALWTDELQYYRRRNDKEPAGTIPLRVMASIVPITKDKTGKRFDIITTDHRVFELMSASPQECQNWVSVATDAIKRAQDLARVERESSDLFNGSTSNFSKVLSSSNLASASNIQTGSTVSSVGGVGSSSSLPGISPLDSSTMENSYLGEEDGEDSEEKEAGEINLAMRVTSYWEDFPVPCGVVYNAVSLEDADEKALIHAVKLTDPNFGALDAAVKKFGSLDHPHIMRQMALGYSSDYLWSIYRPPGFSIAHYLTKHTRFPEKVVRTLAAQVLSALEYLHDKNMSFSMLSSEKIYLEPESGNAHFVDFLLCLDGKHRQDEPSSPEYLCPDGNKTDRRTDWWRFGVLLYEMAVGFPPIRSSAATLEARLAEISQKLESFNPADLPFPPFVSLDFRDIVSQLLVRSASQRLGGKREDAEDVKRHSFFKSGRFDWSSLHTHTIAWLNDHAVDHTVVNYFRVLPAPRFKHGLTMELIQAENLPFENKIFCQIQCENTRFVSEKIERSNPQWNGVYNFDVKNLDSPEGRITVLVLSEGKKGVGSKGGDQLVGTVEFAIPEIWSQHEQNEGHALGGGGAEFISSIIDENGFPTFAELHVKFHLNTTKIDIPFRKTNPLNIPSRQSFREYFGSLDESNNPIFPRESSASLSSAMPPPRPSYTNTSALPPPVVEDDSRPAGPPSGPPPAKPRPPGGV